MNVLGGKSFVGSAWIISSCIRFPDLRAVVARKTIKSLMGSTYITMCKVLRMWGLEEGVNYKMNMLRGLMTFWNGSTISFIELELQQRDLAFERLGSNEWSIGFVDEVSEICNKAIEVLASRLRWGLQHHFKVARLLLTTNPCTTWVRSRFIMNDDGTEKQLDKGDFRVLFSVDDNPDKDFVAIYRANLEAIKDPATKARLLYGNWDWTDTNEAACYWKFDGAKHLVDNLKEIAYDPTRPIILSFDFNTMPYMSCLALQIDYESQTANVLEEILGLPQDKNNNTQNFAKFIKQKYLTEGHLGGLMITGDPAGLQRSTLVQEGVNNYTQIMQELSSAPALHPRKKLLPKQPSQITRLEFINNLLDGYGGWKIKINMNCRRLTEDLIYQKKDPTGGKSKQKVFDHKLGVKVEKYGHLSDALDYALCGFLSDAWSKFNKASKMPSITTFTGNPIYGMFDY